MKYNINNNNISKVFLNLKENITKQKHNIKELLNIDYKYCKFKVDIDILLDIIKKLENEKLNISEEQKIIVHYNGNPYITLNLSILAILTKTAIILEFDDYMLGINRFIVNKTNEILENFQTDNLISILKKDDKINNDVDKIICIDDINKYNKYIYEKNAKAKFFAFDYIDFYSDCEELEELSELIYKYAENNLIPIESYSEFEVDEASRLMQEGLGKKVILLTNNEETKKKINNNLNDKQIFINENPFDKHTRLIDSKIFNI